MALLFLNLSTSTIIFFFTFTKHYIQQKVLQLKNLSFCRGEKTRTSDPLHPMQVR